MTKQNFSLQIVADQSSVRPDRSRGQRCSAATSSATASTGTVHLPRQISQIAGQMARKAAASRNLLKKMCPQPKGTDVLPQRLPSGRQFQRWGKAPHSVGIFCPFIAPSNSFLFLPTYHSQSSITVVYSFKLMMKTLITTPKRYVSFCGRLSSERMLDEGKSRHKCSHVPVFPPSV